MSIGNGFFWAQGNHGLIFDAFEPVILSSVKVYADQSGDRVFIIRNSDGDLVYRKTVFIPEGEFRAQLDFYIPPGNDYRIGLQSDANLYRNTSGFSFPYTIDGLISITEDTHVLDYYHFFL